MDFTPPPPILLSKSSLKLVCNVNILYGNIRSENSPDYAQKPQPNCTFMNSASALCFCVLTFYLAERSPSIPLLFNYANIIYSTINHHQFPLFYMRESHHLRGRRVILNYMNIYSYKYAYKTCYE
jgi:hypothetical protein